MKHVTTRTFKWLPHYQSQSTLLPYTRRHDPNKHRFCNLLSTCDSKWIIFIAYLFECFISKRYQHHSCAAQCEDDSHVWLNLKSTFCRKWKFRHPEGSMLSSGADEPPECLGKLDKWDFPASPSGSVPLVTWQHHPLMVWKLEGCLPFLGVGWPPFFEERTVKAQLKINVKRPDPYTSDAALVISHMKSEIGKSKQKHNNDFQNVGNKLNYVVRFNSITNTCHNADHESLLSTSTSVNMKTMDGQLLSPTCSTSDEITSIKITPAKCSLPWLGGKGGPSENNLLFQSGWSSQKRYAPGNSTNSK